MGIIISKNKDHIIKTLKDNGDHVFKVVKEIIYSIPHQVVNHYDDYNDFVKFAKEHPKKVFSLYHYIIEEIKEFEEL